jgi:short-subunit dehydrogenase
MIEHARHLLGSSRPAASASPGAVIITGGTSGIGRCTAALFSRQGWRVGLIARGWAGLDSTREELERAGGQVEAVSADVANAEAVEDAADELEALLGPIAIWVNCAGNGVFGRFLTVPDDEFRRVTDVTYHGTVNGTRAALRKMLPRDRGTIINVCSGIAHHGMPLLSCYSGAKHAVRGFTDSIRGELRQDGVKIRITIIYPPAVNTPFFSHAVTHMEKAPRPMRPVYQPDVVAKAVLRAASKPRRRVQVGSVTKLFGLVSALAPGLMDLAISRLGYDGQMTDCPLAASLRNPTLFTPSVVPSGAHGPFLPPRRRRLIGWLGRRRVLLPAAAISALGLASWIR